MARVAVTISLSDDERAELEALSRRRKTSQGLARRARIVLAAAEGLENKEVAVRLEASADTVGKWRRRYAAEGLDGLYDEPRPGAPRQIGDDAIAEAVRLTLEADAAGRDPLEPSLDGATGERPRALDHSSHLAGLRLAAASLGDRAEKLSSDPFFVEKVRDIVGLYLAPPCTPGRPAAAGPQGDHRERLERDRASHLSHPGCIKNADRSAGTGDGTIFAVRRA